MSDTSSSAKIPMPRVIANLPTRDPSDYAPPTERDRLAALAKELDNKPLTEIAYRFTHLNFGEMTELAEGIGAEPAKIWAWATRDTK